MQYPNDFIFLLLDATNYALNLMVHKESTIQKLIEEIKAFHSTF